MRRGFDDAKKVNDQAYQNFKKKYSTENEDEK
jgi:hypothetical protein